MSKDKAIVKDEYFKDLITFAEAKSNEVSPVENCKLCQSKYKVDAHKVYDTTRNAAAVVRFLKEKGEEISHPAVNNHINNHYKAIQEHQNIYELAKRLQRWSKINNSDVEMFGRYIKMLDLEVTTLYAELPNVDFATRLKVNEQIQKLMATVSILKDSMKKLDAEKRPVQIFIDSLNRIISIKLEDYKSPEVRQALKEVLDQLAKDVDLANPNIGLKEEE